MPRPGSSCVSPERAWARRRGSNRPAGRAGEWTKWGIERGSAHGILWRAMTPQAFAIYCFVGFLIPVPLLAWLDRPRPKTRESAKPPDPR